MKTSEVLYRAADLIEERGWHGFPSGIIGDPWGGGAGSDAPVCLEGGIIAAMGVALPPHGVTSEQNAERDALLKGFESCPAFVAVAAHIDCGPGDLWAWNDKRTRTATEVIEVLRATAVIEAAKENAEAREPVSS